MANFDALHNLKARMKDSSTLIEFHEDLTGTDAGRRHGVDALNRSALMLSVAAWEGFIEDLTTAAAQKIKSDANRLEKLPDAVRNSFLHYLYESGNWSSWSQGTKDGLMSLVDNNWRDTYLAYVKNLVGKLNTPNSTKVKNLLKKSLGISDCTENWKSGRWTSEHYRQLLDEILGFRHKIAHGVIGDLTISKNRAKGAIKLVLFLAEETQNCVESHVKEIVKK